MQKLSEENKKELSALAKSVRKNIMDMVTPTKSSHVGSSFSTVEILVTLYKLIMKHDPNDAKKQDRDRFLLSKGHACTALYGVLAELGYFPKDFLKEYSKDGSILMSHTNSEVPGVEISTGSLGHALPVGVGMTLSAKTNDENWSVFVLLSDGELNEGSNWEAIMMASHLKMENLFIIVDRNGIQGLSKTEDVINMNPLLKKFEAFNCDALEVDGHNYDDLYETFQKLKGLKTGKPKVVIANTVKGKGVSYMENTIAWHYKSPNAEEYAKGIKELEQ